MWLSSWHCFQDGGGRGRSQQKSREVRDEGHGQARKQNKDNQGKEGKCMLLSLLVEIVSLVTHARVSCCIRKYCPRLMEGNGGLFFPPSTSSPPLPIPTPPAISWLFWRTPMFYQLDQARCSVSKWNHGCFFTALQETIARKLKLLIAVKCFFHIFRSYYFSLTKSNMSM